MIPRKASGISVGVLVVVRGSSAKFAIFVFSSQISLQKKNGLQTWPELRRSNQREDQFSWMYVIVSDKFIYKVCITVTHSFPFYYRYFAEQIKPVSELPFILLNILRLLPSLALVSKCQQKTLNIKLKLEICNLLLCKLITNRFNP